MSKILVHAALIYSFILNSTTAIFLTLGSGQTYGIICGEYNQVGYFPVKEKYYENVCENNCQFVIDNCVKKMRSICNMSKQVNAVGDNFCEFNKPNEYCKQHLRFGVSGCFFPANESRRK